MGPAISPLQIFGVLMLLKLPTELLLRIAESVLLPGIAWRAGLDTLKAMMLTCSTLRRIARDKLFRRLYIANGMRADLVVSTVIVECYALVANTVQLAGLRAWTENERRVVRELHVDHVSPMSGKANKKVSHGALAEFLSLLPHISSLHVSRFLGAKIPTTLATALGLNNRLRTLSISCGSCDAHASGLYALLSSISPTAKLAVLRIDVPSQPKASKYTLPAFPTVSTQTLRISELWHDDSPKAVSRNNLWIGFAACCGTSMSALDIPLSWVHPALLSAVSPTLRALRIRTQTHYERAPKNFTFDLDALLHHSFSHLQSLHLPFQIALSITNYKAPIFAGVRVLVVACTSQPEPTSGPLPPVWNAIGLAGFELVIIAFSHFSSPGVLSRECYPRRGAELLQKAGTQVLKCDGINNPDLLVLLEKRECVLTNGVW